MSIRGDNVRAEHGGAGDGSHSLRQFAVTRTASPPGLRLVGEIDVTNAELVEPTLRAQAGLERSLHLDLSELLFCDVSGIRALVAYAGRLGPSQRLRLHGVPARIEKVMTVVGWSELPGLEFCTCDMET